MTTLGSISHGTLRTQDLFDAFTSTLDEFAPERSLEIEREYQDAYTIMSIGGNERDVLMHYLNDEMNETLSYLVNEVLFDALNEVAPEGAYFGTLEGDGSDFGFWPIEDDNDF